MFYLALGIAGMLGFLVVRPALADPEAAVTVANLQEHETLARVGIALEMAVVLVQSLGQRCLSGHCAAGRAGGRGGVVPARRS